MCIARNIAVYHRSENPKTPSGERLHYCNIAPSHTHAQYTAYCASSYCIPARVRRSAPGTSIKTKLYISSGPCEHDANVQRAAAIDRPTVGQRRTEPTARKTLFINQESCLLSEKGCVRVLVVCLCRSLSFFALLVLVCGRLQFVDVRRRRRFVLNSAMQNV